MPTNTKDYYEAHLGRFYSWMAGDFEQRLQEFYDFLVENRLSSTSGIAYDLGCGHGVQAAALAKAGYNVKAVDFSDQLLAELAINTRGMKVEAIKADIRLLDPGKLLPAGLVVCWGDTLTHLDSFEEVQSFIQNAASVLSPGGTMALSFRDYTNPLLGDSRFIPVKSDDSRILTCVLDFEDTHVRVTDLFHEKTASGWTQKAMSYKKLRIKPTDLTMLLTKNRMNVVLNQTTKGMVTVIALKH